MNAKNKQSHTELLAQLSDQLRDIAASGLRFSKDPHDLENYHTIQTIAMQLFALATDHSLEQIEPLREPIFSRRTPLIIGDGAVIDPHGNILLIQRPRSQAWALPGGAYAVGESPTQGVAREIKEETGISCTPTQLIGIYDSRLHPGPSPQHQYNLVFLCQLDQQPPSTPTHPQETADIGWFPQHQLPTPITPSHQQRIQQAFQAWHGHTTTNID
jgi:ADP-ribose pyrophosphatase YjhB (NUDIX family)